MRADLTAGLAVLAQLDGDELGAADREQLERAVTAAARNIKRRAKARRNAQTIAADRAALATATRFHTEIPPAAPARIEAAPAAPLRRDRLCYVCKEPYRTVDADYHLLCPPCAEVNRVRREARTELTGRTAIVTGGRIKIGFQTALKLLRDGATVLVTTRFPRDAARRFAAVADFADWSGRLRVHGLDLLDLPGLLDFVATVETVDILINNAAQTLARPAAYHREVLAAEGRPLHGPAARLELTGTPQPAGVVTPADFFPAGLTDETGHQLDLRPVNSWVLHDHEVSPQEWLQVHVVNAFAPFLLTSRLRPLLAASPHPVRHVVQVSAMEGSFSRPTKTGRHPHTNMAKAALNMMVRTVAADYARDGILMNAVDTGWVTDEKPHPAKQAHREHGFRPPLDVIDGAARVYHPIVSAAAGEPLSGAFLKDYRKVAW